MTQFPYSAAHQPPIPTVRVTLHAPDGSTMIPSVLAVLDTAASGSLFPLALLRQMGLAPVHRAVVRGVGHAPTTLDLYDVEIEIPGVVLTTARVVGHPTDPYILIGRDILNQFRITFDGPRQMTEFH
jgi:hypothetical protein